MSKTKIINASEEEMKMVMSIYIMPETGFYEAVKSTPSIMDDPYAHVIE